MNTKLPKNDKFNNLVTELSQNVEKNRRDHVSFSLKYKKEFESTRTPVPYEFYSAMDEVTTLYDQYLTFLGTVDSNSSYEHYCQFIAEINEIEEKLYNKRKKFVSILEEM